MTASKGNRFPLSILNPNPHFPETRPSKTALRVAMHRAAHQLLDNPKVFDDPLALAIIGPKAVAQLDSVRNPLRRAGCAKSARVHGGAKPLC